MTVATNTPYDQYTASAGQTVFIYSFEIVEDTDLLVYQRLNTDPANDITDVLNLITDYTVTGVGNENGGTIVLTSGAALNDIVTIKQNVPVGRDTAFTPGGILKAQDLNSEFDNQTLIEQVTRFNEQNRMLRYWNSEIVVEFVDTILPRLEANQVWAMNGNRTAIIGYDVPEGGGLAPSLATYLLQTANSYLPNAQAMDELPSGLVINNTNTGVQITRLLAAVANQLDITDPSGIGGNPTYGFADNAMFPGTEGLGIVFGTTAQRPVTPVGTNLRFNTDLIILEYWDGSDWVQISETDGVFTAEGTEHQVLVNGTFNTPIDGAIKLTLPQDIDLSSSPEFVDLTLSNGAIYDVAGNVNMRLFAQINAVNYPLLLNSATGDGVLYAVGGLDADIDLILLSKGIGSVDLVSRNPTTPVSIFNGTFLLGNPQHQTDFIFANTNEHRLVTFQDSDGTIAFLPSLSVIPTVAGNTILTATSNDYIEFTGVTTQTMTLADVSTLRLGRQLYVMNNSTGAITINSSGGNLLLQMAANTSAFLTTVLNTGTTAASWNASYIVDAGGGVAPGLINQLAWYSATGNIVSGLTTAASSVLVTDGSSVPNLSTTLPAGISASGMFLTAPTVNFIIGASTGTRILTFTDIGGSPVNWINISNATTGLGASIRADGSDSDVQLNLFGKANAPVAILSNSTSPVVFASGTSYQHATYFSFANTAASRTVIFPDASGTALMTGVAINTVPSIAFSSTSGIIGSSTNDSAAAGSVGEIISSSVGSGSALALTSPAARNVTSISLTAGDWDVDGHVVYLPGAGTLATAYSSGISGVSATIPTAGTNCSVAILQAAFPASTLQCFSLNTSRISLGSTLTIYLVGQSSFTVSTNSVYGYIQARRVR